MNSKNSSFCPWRSNGHLCHLIGAGNSRKPEPNFETCLLCTLNEIRRELELRQER
jgi:hypothetical protein